MITIVLNDKRIILSEEYANTLRLYDVRSALIVFQLNPRKITEIIDNLLLSEIMDVVIVGDEEENLRLFQEALTWIQAGGGVVFNPQNEILFIYRKKKWDLPKGKLDPGESIEQCALREVREETGIQQLVLEREVCKTYHIYIETDLILKETTWFLMHSDDKWLEPQKEEGIQKAIWVHRNNIRFQLEKTYPSIIEIFQRLTQLNAHG
jgi:8-oxo-dGTP pyrophosphatase MutT (NUDIX family)